MAFGLAGSESSGSGEFLGRIQFDARTGFFKHVDRTQDSSGAWVNIESDSYQNPTLLVDFGSLEIGYAKISSPPSFLFVPFGQPAPQRPVELSPEGKPAFNPAARVKVMSQKTFGDMEARYFMIANKTGLPAIEEAWLNFASRAEAAAGQVPVMNITTRTVEVKTPQGMSKFKVPVFAIAQWVDRPDALGARIVPPPAPAGHTAPPVRHAAPPQVVNQMPPAAPAPQRQPEPERFIPTEDAPF
jgi:hypothetical protein